MPDEPKPTNVGESQGTPATGEPAVAPQKTATAQPTSSTPEEYKGLQRELARVQKERDDYRARSEGTGELKTLIQELHSRIEGTEARLHDLATLQTAVDEEGKPSTTHYDQYQVKERERKAQRQFDDWSGKVKQTQEKIKSKLKEADIDPESEDWKEVWQDNDLLEATAKLTERLVAKHKKDKETSSADVQKMVDQKVKEGLIAAGVHRVDMAPGAATDWETVRAAFIKNPSNPNIQQQYLRMKQQREGTKWP